MPPRGYNKLAVVDREVLLQRAEREAKARQEAEIIRPVMDGVKPRLYCRDLVLVRPYAFSAAKQFERFRMAPLADLGYARSSWHPLDRDQEGYSSESLAFR